MTVRPRFALYRLSSCGGCQRALLDEVGAITALAELVDIVHWRPLGRAEAEGRVDIALVEGSVSDASTVQWLESLRARSGFLVSLGACATAGGPQALRPPEAAASWKEELYASPGYVPVAGWTDSVACHVPVDAEIEGCPVNGARVLDVIRDLLAGVAPRRQWNSVCLECKQRLAVCVTVAQGSACLGPVTQAGCGALCPGQGRGCYGCFGRSETMNGGAMRRCLLRAQGKDPGTHFDLFHTSESARPRIPEGWDAKR